MDKWTKKELIYVLSQIKNWLDSGYTIKADKIPVLVKTSKNNIVSGLHITGNLNRPS